MSCKKRSGNATSNFIIGVDKNRLNKKDFGFLGKIRSNFKGSEWQIFDTGDNPKKTKTSKNARKELAVVLYNNKLPGEPGPTRKMWTLIPNVADDYTV